MSNELFDVKTAEKGFVPHCVNMYKLCPHTGNILSYEEKKEPSVLTIVKHAEDEIFQITMNYVKMIYKGEEVFVKKQYVFDPNETHNYRVR